MAVLSPVVVDDPYIWLEEKDGASDEWVAIENGKTLPRLENDPRYAGFYMTRTRSRPQRTDRIRR
jgi:prolyl oligopeptidase